MIVLNVNGETKELPQALTVTQALRHWGYGGDNIAVAINGEFVPRSTYDQHALQAKDRIEIVAPIQGG